MKYIYILALSLLTFGFGLFAQHMTSTYVTRSGRVVAAHISMDKGESKATGWHYHHNQLIREK